LQDPTGEAASEAQKHLTYYELDLGLNHVVRKWSDPVDNGANLLIPVPGTDVSPVYPPPPLPCLFLGKEISFTCCQTLWTMEPTSSYPCQELTEALFTPPPPLPFFG